MTNIATGYSKVIGSAMRKLDSTKFYGDGRDGNAVISSNTQLPVVEDSGYILKRYNTLTVNANTTLKPSTRCAGMFLLVRGDYTINGTIDVSKCSPRSSPTTEAALINDSIVAHLIALIQSEEYVGGNGGAGGGTNGGAGGNGFIFGGGYGGGGGGCYRYTSSGWDGHNSDTTTYPAGGASEPRPPITLLWPQVSTSSAVYGAGATASSWEGGAAPGGGGGTGSVSESWYLGADDGHYSTISRSGTAGSDGDAYGGGALWLVVGGTLTINGSILANGGNGGAGYSTGGGGGGGGIISIFYRTAISNNGTITATGGNMGNGTKNGSDGIVYISQLSNSGNIIS